MQRPAFKACFRVETVPPGTVFVMGEDTYATLAGPIYPALVPLLNGQHSTDAIIVALSGTAAPHEVLFTLEYLRRRGLVIDAAQAQPGSRSAFWQAIGADEQTAPGRMAQATVALHALEPSGLAPLRHALAAHGVRVVEAEDDADLLIVLTADYTAPTIEAANSARLAAGRPWMLARLVGTTVWIGPIFNPGEGPCWACLAQRLHANRQVESYLLQRTGRAEPFPTARAALPTTVTLGAQLTALEVVKWVARAGAGHLADTLITIDTLTGTIESHSVVRRPQCKACGSPEPRQDPARPRPIVLQSRQKRYTIDGGHRTALPEETLARFGHHVSPLTGVVSSLQELLGVNNGLTYSYSAGHNFAMVTDDLSILRTNLRSRSGGKGMTDTQAKVSAIGEAIERYSGVYRPEEERVVRGSLRTLGPSAIPLHQVLCFSEAQYMGRREWNRKLSAQYHLVPHPFDPEAEYDWTALWSLSHERVRLLPTAYCYYGHPEIHRFFCASDANGCASGNTVEEAIIQGFLELVERDAVAIWWYNQLRRPAVDARSFGIGDYYRRLEQYYAAIGRSIWVLDITSDLQVPTFVAVSGRLHHACEDIIIGAGSHFDPQVALSRALTELNQFLPAVFQQNAAGETTYTIDDQDAISWFKTARMAAQRYLVPDEGAPARTAADFVVRRHTDLRDDVLHCVDLVAQAGMEFLVLDQTRQDIGMPVVRVVVPGMRHFWRRLGPGRLYDVPVAMGWLKHPTPEAEMNPLSMFF